MILKIGVIKGIILLWGVKFWWRFLFFINPLQCIYIRLGYGFVHQHFAFRLGHTALLSKGYSLFKIKLISNSLTAVQCAILLCAKTTKNMIFKILHSFSRGTGQSINKILNNIVKGEIWHPTKMLKWERFDTLLGIQWWDFKLFGKYFHLTFNSTKFLPWKCYECQNTWIKQKFMETNRCVMAKFLLLFILFIWSPSCPSCSASNWWYSPW